MSLISSIFLKLIKMIIGPLVLSTLVVGIGHMGDAATVGRVGAKTMAWFVCASIVSLLLGLVMVESAAARRRHRRSPTRAATTANLTTQAFSIENFIDHVVPTSIFKSLADGEILQIVVFSIFAGVALMALGERGKPLIELADNVSHMMLNITGYVMKLAPIAVCASVASVITKSGPGILLNFAKFLGGFYLTLAHAVGHPDRGRLSDARLAHVRSRAAHVRAVPARLLDRELGSVLSEDSRAARAVRRLEEDRELRAAARLFLQPRRHDGLLRPSPPCSSRRPTASTCRSSKQLAMAAVLMITSKGVAGVPRASLVVILATLKQFGIPEAGLLLILGIDQFLDMGRSATNVIGNSLAASAVAKFENELGPAQDDARRERRRAGPCLAGMAGSSGPDARRRVRSGFSRKEAAVSKTIGLVVALARSVSRCRLCAPAPRI